MNYQYTFEGTLSLNNPTYIKRQADEDLYNSLKAGQFCYVFNSRKSGKSSLRVRVMNRLLAENINCTAIDLSLDEVQLTSSDRWYFGILDSLTEDFDLDIDLDSWWEDLANLSPLARFKKFIETVLLVKLFGKIVIFFDEIDSVLSLNFPTDDFFAFIRACYNLRVDKPAFDRLTFCLLGVAMPSTLIADKRRTPFNIGKGIDLAGFTLDEAKPLLKGFTSQFAEPEKLLSEILFWSGGQPFLTQKLCYLVLQHSEIDIEKLVRKYIIENWETQDEPEHLKTIRDRLLFDEQKTGKLLGLYQQILENKEIVADNNPVAMELRLSGIVVKKDSKLKAYNLIYETVFDRHWISEQLNLLRPYSRAIEVWLSSHKQDDSRLLRGKALKDALTWKIGKYLTADDEDFLAASLELESLEKQRFLDAARTKDAEAKLAVQKKLLAAEKKNARLQKVFLAVTSAGLIVTSIVGIFAYNNYKKASINEIRTISRASVALFAANNNLDAIVLAIKAKTQLEKMGVSDKDIQQQVDRVLQKAVYKVKEYNRLSAHQDRVYGVAVSSDGNIIASASRDRTIKLWQNDGTLLHTLQGHTDEVYGVAISSDLLIVSGSWDKTVKLWDSSGTLLRTFDGHRDKVYAVAVSSDGNIIASASADRTVKLWQNDGTLLHTLTGHQGQVRTVAITPDGNYIVSGSEDNSVKLWDSRGNLLNTFNGHSRSVRAVAISNDGNIIASASRDRTVKLWDTRGDLISTFNAHTAPVYGVAISPDGNYIASGSADNTVKLWQKDGTLLSTFNGHSNRVWGVVFSPDGKSLISGSWDKTVKLWRAQRNLLSTLIGHRDVVIDIDFGKDIIATASDDETVKLWRFDRALLTNFDRHSAEVYAVSISPDGNYIASAGAGKNILLWKPDGTLLAILKGHQDDIWSIDIVSAKNPIDLVSESNNKIDIVSAKNPIDLVSENNNYNATVSENNYIVSGSADRTIKIWKPNGRLVRTLKGHRDAVRSVKITPDGKYIVSAGEDKTIKIWQLDNGTLVNTISGHQDAIWSVTVTPDGKYIISAGDDKTIKIWKPNGRLVRKLEGHTEAVKRVKVSPDGKKIVSVSDDRTVKIWSIEGKLLKTLNGHNAPVWGVSFSKDSKTLASGSEDKTVILWNVDKILELDELKYSCAWVRNYLQNNLEVKDSEQPQAALRSRSLCRE